MTTSNPAISVVERFLDALRALDTDAALALMADDVTYHNVSLPPARGKDAVAKQFGMFARHVTEFDVIVHHIAADGDPEQATVLTERTDILRVGPVRSQFWVCGTYQVRDGRIVLWRDYFDWANLLAGTVKGAGRAVAGLVTGRRG
jgi:limonene-1,2-epoxide hydrolase